MWARCGRRRGSAGKRGSPGCGIPQGAPGSPFGKQPGGCLPAAPLPCHPRTLMPASSCACMPGSAHSEGTSAWRTQVPCKRGARGTARRGIQSALQTWAEVARRGSTPRMLIACPAPPATHQLAADAAGHSMLDLVVADAAALAEQRRQALRRGLGQAGHGGEGACAAGAPRGKWGQRAWLRCGTAGAPPEQVCTVSAQQGRTREEEGRGIGPRLVHQHVLLRGREPELRRGRQGAQGGGGGAGDGGFRPCPLVCCSCWPPSNTPPPPSPCPRPRQ